MFARWREQIVVADRAFLVRRGDSYLIPPGVLADIGSRDGRRPVWVHFDVACGPRRAPPPVATAYDDSLHGREAFLQPGPRAVWGVELPVLAPPPLRPVFAGALASIVRAWKRGDPLSILEANHQLAGLLLTWVSHQWRLERPGPVLSLEARLERAERAARQNLALGFGVKAFAAAAGYSRWRFAALYAAHRQLSPGEFLRRERLRLAETLLLRSDLPVREVGQQVGYADATVFGRVFRAAHGLTPAQ